jgi:hypothetical protein
MTASEHNSLTYWWTDRRKNGPRFSISAPAVFQWKQEEGTSLEGNGVTRDISAHGIFVMAQAAPQASCEVEVSVALRPPVFRGANLHLRGVGSVVRVDSEGSEIVGFAAFITFSTDKTAGG